LRAVLVDHDRRKSRGRWSPSRGWLAHWPRFEVEVGRTGIPDDLKAGVIHPSLAGADKDEAERDIRAVIRNIGLNLVVTPLIGRDRAVRHVVEE
jgi:hypothetical protein